MAHFGVIHELERRGYEIGALAGTSIGAMVAGAYASGKHNELEAFLSGLSFDDVAHYMDPTLSSDGFLKGARVFERMQEFWPDCLIEQLPIPLAIVATDLNTGRSVVFRSGSLYRAIRASISIPLLFTLQRGQGHILVDGGLTGLLPFDHIERPRGSLLAAVNLYGKPEPGLDIQPNRKGTQPSRGHRNLWNKISMRWDEVTDWKPLVCRMLMNRETDSDGFFQVLRKSAAIMMETNARQSIRLNRPDILVEIPSNCAGALDFYCSRSLIALGAERGRRALDSYEESHGTWLSRLRRQCRWTKWK